MRLKKLERFKLWRLGPNSDLHRQLANCLSVLAIYFDREEISFAIVDEMSFLDGLDHLLHRLDLKAWPVGNDGSRLELRCPLFARDRKDDSLSVLLPRRDKYIAVKSNEVLPVKKIRERYDEITQIFSVNNNLREKKFSSMMEENLLALPSGALVVISGLTMMLVSAIILLAMARFYEFADDNYLALNLGAIFCTALVMMITKQGQDLSLQNFAPSAVEIFNNFYRRIFNLALEQFVVTTPMQFLNMASRLRAQISEHFLERFRLLCCFCGLIITALLSFIINLWFALLIISSFVVGIVFTYYGAGKKNGDEQIHHANMQKILSNYALSLDALRGLKAFHSILKKLHRAKGFLSEEMLRAYAWRNARSLSYVLLPFFYVVVFALFIRDKIETFSPWQTSFALVSAIGAGVMLAHIINHRRQITKDFIDSVDQWNLEIADAHVDPVNLRGQIEITKVNFGYQEMGTLIFKNYSQKVLPGKFYNFYGESDSGKSTLIALLLGFLNPSSGQIIFDNQDLRSLNKQKLRRHFGVILENSTLFPGSVYDNILCGRDIPKKALENLLLSHAIFDHIIDLPMGLETFVFWHQKNLSRLEKTVVLLARALVHQPQFIFLDDVFTGLPEPQKEELLSFLTSLELTRIVMTTTALDDESEDTIIRCPLQNSTESS